MCTLNHFTRLTFRERDLSHAKVHSRRRSVLDARLFSFRAGREAGRPGPPPADRPARSQIDDGRAQDRKPAPGADGRNRNAANAANYDESKANPYPNLPDPLTLKNGEKVTAPEQWWNKRRPEIVEDFDREVYGRVPMDVPKVTWEVTGTTEEKIGDVAAVTKRLVGHVDNAKCPQIKVDIQLTLTTPITATGPVPVMMEFGFGGFGPRPGGRLTKAAIPKGGAPKAKTGPAGGFGGGGPSWQQQVLAQGWGYAIIVPNSIQADDGGGLTSGIIGLCNKGQARKPDDWGALRAWAWGASRALDYFETDKAVDAKQVGIEGLSRYGKAALVAMAYDQRFAIGFIGSSGEGGAKLHRRNFGELVENLTGSGEYHWMAGNFLKYGGPLTPGDLPVDAHELIALCAARRRLSATGRRPVRAPRDSGSISGAVSWRPSRPARSSRSWERRTWEPRNSRRWRRKSPAVISPSASTRGATPPYRTGRRS